MTFTDHLKGNQPELLMLEVAFGTHLIEGDLGKSVVTGASPTHVVTIQQLLGEAFGHGWQGPRGVWYSGTVRPSTKYKFFPGIMSPGNADTTQGIDTFFDQDTPHSNTAWIRLECPSGSEVGIPDFDTKKNPPKGHFGIYDCQLGDRYDSTGGIDDTDVFLVNPADVAAFLCKVVRKFPNARINWTSLATLRTLSDVPQMPDYTTLPQGVGLTGSYYSGTNFGTLVTKRVDPVIDFPSSNGSPAVGIDPNNISARWEGKIRPRYTETLTVYVTHDNGARLWIDDLSTPLIDQWSDDGMFTSGVHSATIALNADQFYDIKLEWNGGGVPEAITLEWESTSQPREVIPQDRSYPKNEAVPRFECHAKFTERTALETALQQVMFTCNGAYQDANGELRFFCVADETPSFDFDETNIQKGTFKYIPRFSQAELLLLPNRYIADARDLDSPYLEKFDPPLYYDLPNLQDVAGRVIEETVPAPNLRRWQGLENLAHYARLKTAPMVAEFEGLPITLPVLPGDVVTVTKADYGLDHTEFLCVEATDKSTDKAPDNRLFKLILWE